jgi:hypothetical protein
MYDRTARVGVAGVAVVVCLKLSFFKTRRVLICEQQSLKIFFEYPN